MSRLPDYLNPDSIKRTANKKEAKVFKHLVSGALDHKGDFSDKDTVMDLKATEKQSITITVKMLDKLIQDSLAMGKSNSVLILDIDRYYITCNVTVKTRNLK